MRVRTLIDYHRLSSPFGRGLRVISAVIFYWTKHHCIQNNKNDPYRFAFHTYQWRYMKSAKIMWCGVGGGGGSRFLGTGGGTVVDFWGQPCLGHKVWNCIPCLRQGTLKMIPCAVGQNVPILGNIWDSPYPPPPSLRHLFLPWCVHIFISPFVCYVNE